MGNAHVGYSALYSPAVCSLPIPRPAAVILASVLVALSLAGASPTTFISPFQHSASAAQSDSSHSTGKKTRSKSKSTKSG